MLRGRESIRQRHAPDADLPEDESGDEDASEDDTDYRVSHSTPASPSTQARPASHTSSRHEPVFAARANEPAIDWDALRRADDDRNARDRNTRDHDDRDDDRDDRAHNDLDHDRDHDRDHDNDRNHDYRDTAVRDDPLDPDDDRGHHIRIDHYDDEPDVEPDDAREPVLGDTRTRYSSATDVGRAPPEFLDQDRQERRGLFRKIWAYACLVGLIALGLQLLFIYRTDIANSVPVLRPVLETVCKPLDCTVGYARRLERIAISSSSLQPPTGAAAIDDGRSRLVLNLVLRNRYDKPQHWPALVLDLTDLSDTVVVRKVLRPENYLTPEQLRGPFGPAGELKISVPIEVTGVQVNGYQLDKFFP